MARAGDRDTLFDETEAGRSTLPSSEVQLEERAEPAPAARRTDPTRLDDQLGDLEVGQILGGRYRLERVLGKGATGTVFEASHLLIGKRVALKCVHTHLRTIPSAVERFLREAKIAATVEHPNVIQVFDGGDDPEALFLAMELLSGETLADRIERAPLELGEAARIFLEIMDGIAAVHDLGVVHRDLKPENVFLQGGPRRGSVKVLDFGISKLKEPGTRELTSLGTVMGTPYYMAPEQITDTRNVDARADVYAIGVMLYEALTGDVPYPEVSVVDIFSRASLGNPRPVRAVRGDVPEALEAIVLRALLPSREDRYPSVRLMRDALAALGLNARPAAADIERATLPAPAPMPRAAPAPGPPSSPPPPRRKSTPPPPPPVSILERATVAVPKSPRAAAREPLPNVVPLIVLGAVGIILFALGIGLGALLAW